MNISNISQINDKIRGICKGGVALQEPLKHHTTIGIGGAVSYFLSPDDMAQLSEAVKFLSSNRVPLFVIGRGSNLLITDAELPFAVIKLKAACFKNMYRSDNRIFAGSGVGLREFVNFAASEDLANSEFLTGIPGTIGGALMMNAGVRDVMDDGGKKDISISGLVEKIQVMDKTGKVCWLSRQEISFGYRSSSLKEYILLGAWFVLCPERKKNISERMKRFLAKKSGSQELVLPSAGCIFKNPKNCAMSAGELIERCKLKGYSIGDAQVSGAHANFIINKGDASYQEVKALMNIMREMVLDKFGIELEPEVEIWENKKDDSDG
ncbi:MAG: UDP-N-acetylmuramate dehydrogenase [Candidatus Omnitrophota bacterium]